MESVMSIKTKIAAVAVAGLALSGGFAATTTQAQAGHHGVGIGLGIATGALVGAAIASGAYADGYAYRRCGWVRQYDAYGHYIGRVRTCNY
jgi:hypothetical protein